MSETESVAEYLDEDGDVGHREWAAALRDGVLLGLRCGDCDRAVGAPKAACPYCGARALAPEALPTRGEVHSETTIGVPPEGVDASGYTVAVVQLGDARVMGRIDAAVAIGDAVALDGVIEGDRPAPVFAPDA